MKQYLKKLGRQQVQEKLDKIGKLANIAMPKTGWVKTIREALSMSIYALAAKLDCKAANITNMEKREMKGTIKLETLEQAAQAMDCKLVYYFIPNKPLDKMLEDQARKVARKQMKSVQHSMSLEDQALNKKKLQQKENALVEELLRNPKKIWS